MQQSRWQTSRYATPYFDKERSFLKQGLLQAIGPSVLQIGSMLDSRLVDELDLPRLVRAGCEQGDQGAVDVFADPAFLPFDVDSFSTVVLPHVLEMHTLPHQVLREAHRVLMPEGYIVLTGFNPLSLIGLQRWIRKRSVPPGRYYTVGRVVDWLQLLNFEVAASTIFHYPPMTKRERLRSSLSFLESVGNRWLPMSGGAYLICARKRVSGNTLIGKSMRVRAKPTLVPAAARHTKTAGKQQSL